MNKQSPLPALGYEGRYLVHSIFRTIQGEGPFAGDGAVFIRLVGCNLQCPLCDTEYSSTERGGLMLPQQVVGAVGAAIGETAVTLVVITGGEPFRQDLTDLVALLREAGYRVQIETNGTMAPSDAFKEYCEANYGVGIVISPKAHYVDPWLASHAIAYKYVLSHDAIDPDDGLPINVLGRVSKRVARPPVNNLPIYIQPADPALMPNGFEELGAISAANHKACVESAIQHGYRLQLQIHKHLGVE